MQKHRLFILMVKKVETEASCKSGELIENQIGLDLITFLDFYSVVVSLYVFRRVVQ